MDLRWTARRHRTKLRLVVRRMYHGTVVTGGACTSWASKWIHGTVGTVVTGGTSRVPEQGSGVSPRRDDYS